MEWLEKRLDQIEAKVDATLERVAKLEEKVSTRNKLLLALTGLLGAVASVLLNGCTLGDDAMRYGFALSGAELLPMPSSGEEVPIQRASAVEVYVECDFPKLDIRQKALKAMTGFSLTNRQASGLAISPNSVGTALHVVDCDEYPHPFLGRVVDGSPRKIEAAYRGNRYPLKIEHAGYSDDRDRYVDAVMLVSADGQAPFSVFATKVGERPKLNDEVCVVASRPFASRSCGPITEFRSGDRWMGNRYIVYKLQAIPGNSGSGVYDSKGALIAIHVAGVGDDRGGGFLITE